MDSNQFGMHYSKVNRIGWALAALLCIAFLLFLLFANAQTYAWFIQIFRGGDAQEGLFSTVEYILMLAITLFMTLSVSIIARHRLVWNVTVSGAAIQVQQPSGRREFTFSQIKEVNNTGGKEKHAIFLIFEQEPTIAVSKKAVNFKFFVEALKRRDVKGAEKISSR